MKQRMKRRRDRFVVGYLGAKNLAFSSHKDLHCVDKDRWSTAIEPMTRLEAQRLLLKMPCANCAVFELVPVKVNR